MNIRSEFFRSGVSFYNAGVSGPMPDYPKRLLTEMSRDKRPRLVILGLDQRWFSPRFPEAFSLTDTTPALNQDPAWGEFFKSAWKQIYADYFFDKRFRDAALLSWRDTRRIGLNAAIQKFGFRNDGSFYYEEILNDPNRQTVLKKAIDAQIEKIGSAGKFEYGKELNFRSVSAIEDFLEYCKTQDITVIGYLPPFAPGIFEKIESLNNEDKRAVDQLKIVLQGEFNRRSFAFYDLTDARTFGSKDDEFIDPMHGSDMTLARALLYMAAQNKELKGILDVGGTHKSNCRIERYPGNIS